MLAPVKDKPFGRPQVAAVLCLGRSRSLNRGRLQDREQRRLDDAINTQPAADGAAVGTGDEAAA